KIGPDPRNFNQRVSLGRNDLLIRTFLSASVDNVLLSQWLDRQTFSFSSWSPEDARTATSCIMNNSEIFPLICRNSQYIKNRMLPEKADVTEDSDTFPD
ncbi:hypothetical protein QDQ20_12320, partial [Enterobacter hormaechei]